MRKIKDSPLEISQNTSMTEMEAAIADRQSMIEAIMELAAFQLERQIIPESILSRLGAAADLLNNEVDALEQVTLLH
ncbi:hypothetical protein EYC98_02620 [Halieaceae bacterium IMCC14734]|uniref:Uncharacterized protein n=1 Tax=Candidatus Litorirhabdus singularis TaxID=2518993 RepID=A0ABT3TBU7_9GAMM|nr:hypothetical protein [Candidatus Litorirhabdus singularis]MCX2979753.1 hypothetical protein [Candidatus Litorirhabdus singularis]